MNTVKQMLDIKGREVWSIGVSQSVYQAIEMMEEKTVGALPVLDDDARLVGLVSERDYARKVILRNKSSRDTSVADIMTTDVVSVAEDTTVDTCMSLLSDKQIRHLPVMDGEVVVGIITVHDLLKFINNQQSRTIDELKNYLVGETGSVRRFFLGWVAFTATGLGLGLLLGSIDWLLAEERTRAEGGILFIWVLYTPLVAAIGYPFVRVLINLFVLRRKTIPGTD